MRMLSFVMGTCDAAEELQQSAMSDPDEATGDEVVDIRSCGFSLDQITWVVVSYSRDVTVRVLMTVVGLSANVVWKTKEMTAGRAEKLA